jgi:hypothetical protein
MVNTILFKMSETYNQDALTWDLRMIYANEIVGTHLKDIMSARKINNHPLYFKYLKELFIVIRHKIKNKKYPPREKKGKDKEQVNAIDHYNVLINQAVFIINKHERVFIGKWGGSSKDMIGTAAIEKALNEIEMFLYEMIDEAKMFGKTKGDEGL